MTNDRMASSLARPPALRITCASPLLNPAYLAGSSRASMQVRIAKPRAGGSASSLLAPKLAAYSSLAPIPQRGWASKLLSGGWLPFPEAQPLADLCDHRTGHPAARRRAARFHQIVRNPSRARLDQLVERARALDTKKRHRWRFPAPPASRPG